MKHKVVIVTGANSGIGKATAIGLAKSGATVIMACRDLAAGSEALSEVRSLGGSDRIHLMQVDLASQASIQSFARAFLEKFDRLDVLIHNAGLAPFERTLTADGFEMQFGVHHLGPFLLTNALLPLLEHSAPSRIVLVVGSAQRSGKIDWDDLQAERKYSMMRASGQSRLANLLFMRGLSGRMHGVTVTRRWPA